MVNEVLVINQEHYKQLNNDQIVFCNGRIADLRQQIVSYGGAIDENEQNIKAKQEEIVRLEASNLAIDETIVILKAE
jgi:predicted  nucleic acid-binding Zn-ribbon protein